MGVTVSHLIAPLRAGARLHGRFIVHSVDEARATVTIARGKSGHQVVVELRPRNDARPCYEVTRSLNVSYVGRPGESLPPDASKALRALVELIQANDRGEPLDVRPVASLPVVAPKAREVATVVDGDAFVRIDSTCEMACVFCTRGEGGSLPKPRSLSLKADVETEIDRVIADGARVVTFGGDEPLTHPDIEAFIRRAVRRGAEGVQIVTSGHRLRRSPGVTHLCSAKVTHTRNMDRRFGDPGVGEGCRGNAPRRCDGLSRR